MRSHRGVLPLARIQARVGRAFPVHADAQERAEGIEGVKAPVKAERELIQVGLKVLRLDAPMMRADARHFLHALRFLKPGGRIVAIMSAAVTFRDTENYRTIRDMARASGSIETLPANSFKKSGTGVNTALVVYDKLVS